jgi:hypothetical protein
LADLFTPLLAIVLDPLRRSICGPHANRGEASFKPTLDAVSPTHIFPFFPPRLCETAILEECVSDHGHEGMTMEALPRSSLEVIEPEFLFQLLMGLLQR